MDAFRERVRGGAIGACILCGLPVAAYGQHAPRAQAMTPQATSVTIQIEERGPARVRNAPFQENGQPWPQDTAPSPSDYYSFRVKVRFPQGAKLVLKQDNCVLEGKDGRKYTEYYVALWDQTTYGFSEEVHVPIAMRTFYILLDQPWANKFVTKTVTGPKGSLVYSHKYGGAVKLFFLWRIPRGLQPKRIVLADSYKFDF